MSRGTPTGPERVESGAPTGDAVDRLATFLRQRGTSADVADRSVGGLTAARLGDSFVPLVDAIVASANPLLALDGLVSLAQAIDADPETPPILRYLTAENEARAFVALLAASRFLTDSLVRHPIWTPWAFENARRSWSRRELRADLDRATVRPRVADPPDWSVLRQWHERHLLRIGWADLAGWLDVMQAAGDLAALADVTVDAVSDVHLAALVDRYGEPREENGGPAGACIIGLGKLGGEELNFRSDIDLMFLYSAEGETSGGTSTGTTLFEFYSRWAERTIDTLAEVSPDGLLYRVDTRLRPEGRSGSIARSLQSYELYYETRGEVWERQMLIKARPIAGDLKLGEALLASLEPFVFPRMLESSPRDEIRRVKQRILGHLAAQDADLGGSRSEDNLKLRRGGLRDIEFVIQCLQLVVGGTDRRIRSRSTIEAIAQMKRRQVLEESEANALDRAYRFLRRIEHRLQMTAGQQTFALPPDDGERESLARSLGYETKETFLGDLEAARETITRIYDNVLGSPESPDEISLLLEMPDGSEAANALLALYGFRDPLAAHRNLRQLAYGREQAVAPAGPRATVVRLAPSLLEQLRKSPDPDRGIRNFEQILAALGAVESFADMLASHASFLELLVTLASRSQSLTDSVVRDPALIDWMLYSGVLLAQRSPREVDMVLRASVAGLGTLDDVRRALHAFRKQEVLRVGLRLLVGIASEDETAEQLTAVADAAVRMAYRLALADDTARHGPLAANAGIAVIGLGKVGAAALNFGSDLDLVFVHSDDGGDVEGTSAVERYAGIAQAIIRELSEPTRYGTLYDVDARLRPEGRSGPLTVALSGYEHYLTHRASTWERQALANRRIIAAPEGLAANVRGTIDRFVHPGVADAATAAGLIDDVASMRKRMEDDSAKRYPGRANIKTGAGGLVDAEFVAQLGVLLFGPADPELRGGATLGTLAHLASVGRLCEETSRRLAEGYRELRGIQMALRINDDRAHNVLPDDSVVCEVLARARGFESASALRDRVALAMRDSRHAYDDAMVEFRNAIADRTP